MVVAFVTEHLTAGVKSAGTTHAFSLNSTVTAGNLLVAVAVFDNAGTASKPVISSIGKAAGESANWVFLGAARSTSTSSGAFASGEMWAIKTTVTWTSGTSLTFTYDTSITMKAENILEFSGADTTLRSTVGTAYSTTSTAASATTTGTTPVIGDLALGFLFTSNAAVKPGADTDVLGGPWDGAIYVGTSGGSGATNNAGSLSYKILTGANHQTLNASGGTTAGNGSIVAILQATIDPLVTQAAYRFYADGTETGATALAAQDTAADVDISSGDVNLQLRVRLQETAGGTPAATDDWQLQWKKGGDGYNFSNWNVDSPLRSTQPQLAQSYLGDGNPLTGATFYLQRGAAAPSGTVSAALWAHDGGTFGGTGLPTGSPLATSTDSITASTVPTFPATHGAYFFTFDGTFTPTAGTPYFIGLVAAGASTNAVNVARDSTSPTHPGAFASFTTSWAASSANDLIFEVGSWASPASSTVVPYASANLTDAAATTNRLGAGTGSFVAGKVSEDGLADDVGWTASNYTELLYSVTLKQADLADGDTLRFRVLRNGATTGMTYTTVPTITIASGPTEHTATATLAVTTTATATAVPDKLATTTALTVTTTATAAATRSTFATTTPLAVTTSRTADATATTPGATAPTVVAGFSDNPGTTSTALITATLPAGIQDGDQGLFLVCFNTESATAADPTTQGGWDQIGLDTIGGTNIFTMTLFGTELSAADSGTTVESVLSGSARWACAGIVVRGANPSYDTTALATFSATADTSFPYPSVTPVSANDLLVLLSAHRYTAAVTTGVTHDADWTEYADTATTNTTNPIFGASVAARTLTGQAGVNQTGDTGTTAGASREASWIIAFKGTVGAPTVHEATAALAVTATLSAAATRSTSVTATALAVTTSRTAAATRTTFTTTTALAVTTNRTAAATRATSSATTALAITTTATAAATKASVQTATTTPLAVTTTIAGAASRATFATTTALAVTTSRTAAATRTGFATAALAITTTATAAAARATFSTTTALAVTTNRTAAATHTVSVGTTALAVTTSRTAAASRQTFTTTTALAVTTSRTAAASRATFATTTALAVTITTTAAAIKTAAGTVAAIPLAVTTTIGATAAATLRTTASLAITTSRTAAATRTTTVAASLAVTTSRTAAATHTVAVTASLTVTTSRTATAVPTKLASTTQLVVTSTITTAAVTVPVTLATTTPLVVTTSRTATATVTAAPTDFGHVVIDGALLPIVNRWVIVGGIKKPVVNQHVVIAGEKK